MKPDGFRILQQFCCRLCLCQNSDQKKNKDQKVQSAAYIIFHSIFGVFQLFGVGFFFSEKKKAAVEFTIVIVILISCFHNSTLQEFSNISDGIYTWLCLIIVKKTAIIQDVAVAEEAVVNPPKVGGRHWLKETELFLLGLVSAYLKYCLTNFKSVYLQRLHSLRVHI